jgi:hypothetical protein
MDHRVDITDAETPQTVQFSYSVEWYEAARIPWKDRFTFPLPFVPSSFEIHWLSIIHSFVLILLLAAFLTKQLRGLKHKQSQYIEISESMTEQIRFSKLADRWLEDNNARPTEFDTEPSDTEEVR